MWSDHHLHYQIHRSSKLFFLYFFLLKIINQLTINLSTKKQQQQQKNQNRLLILVCWFTVTTLRPPTTMHYQFVHQTTTAICLTKWSLTKSNKSGDDERFFLLYVEKTFDFPHFFIRESMNELFLTFTKKNVSMNHFKKMMIIIIITANY